MAVLLVGTAGSVLAAQGWRSTVRRQREERLDRTAASRTVTISGVLGNYENALRYVTLYSYPRIPSSSLLGADARAVPGVLVPLEEARDSASPTLSNQTTLGADLDLPEAHRPVAFELFVPVYGTDDPGASVASRRRSFQGWATGQFRAADFLEAALRSPSVPTTTAVELHDQGVGSDSLVASYPQGFRAQGPDVREERFDFGGRTFTLRYTPLPGNAILTDALTGVANRRAWDDELPRELARATRSGCARPTCSLGVAAWDGREEAAGLVARADQAPAVADAAPGR